MSTKHFIHERSNIIPIEQKITTYMKKNIRNDDYSLKQNFFDPTKSSPPNDFMLKLHLRMNKYYFDNKDDSFAIK